MGLKLWGKLKSPFIPLFQRGRAHRARAGEPVDRSTKCKKGRIFREKFGRTLTFK